MLSNGGKVTVVAMMAMGAFLFAGVAVAEETEAVERGGFGAEGRVKPPPLNVEYWQFGAALQTLGVLNSGRVCPSDATIPCILGPGAGFAARAGYRGRGHWFIGGHYSLAKLDTQGLMRLGVLQQLNGETRYLLNLGQQTEPYLTGGIGAVVFGNEWSVQNWGLTAFAGVGFEVQMTRTSVIGLTAVYRPIYFFDWADEAGQLMNRGVAHFWSLSLIVEAREALESHGASK